MKPHLLKLLLFSVVLLFLTVDFVLADTGNEVVSGRQYALKQHFNSFSTYTPPLFSNGHIKHGFPFSWGAGFDSFIFAQHYAASKLTLQNEIVKAYSDSLTQNILGGGSRMVLRPDIWVLPYLNVYGMVGYSRGYLKPDITANGINLEFPYQDTVYTIFLDTNVIINKPSRYSGLVYGIGATFFYSYLHYFIEVDYNYSEVRPKGMNSVLVSHRFSPKIGRVLFTKRHNHSVTIWLGASWLEDSQTLTGVVNVREVAGDLANYIGEEAVYTVEVSPVQRWNMALGGSYSINRHFDFAVEIGFIGRKKLALGFLYRI
jgi:hypothetical protein